MSYSIPLPVMSVETLSHPGKTKKDLLLDGESLTVVDLIRAAEGQANVYLPEYARQKAETARKFVEEKLESGAPLYGINTGFGRLANVSIPEKDLAKLQLNLIRSHCCGVGKLLSIRETRALILLIANVLAKGNSCIRPIVIESLIEMLNRGVTPVISEKGSVGSVEKRRRDFQTPN